MWYDDFLYMFKSELNCLKRLLGSGIWSTHNKYTRQLEENIKFKGILGSIKDVLREKCYIYSDLDLVSSQKIKSQTWMTFKSK